MVLVFRLAQVGSFPSFWSSVGQPVAGRARMVSLGVRRGDKAIREGNKGNMSVTTFAVQHSKEKCMVPR